MKRIITAYMSVAFAILPVCFCAAAPTLSLEAPKRTFLVGEAVPLILTISNPSSEPLVLATSSENAVQSLVQGLEILVWDGARYVPPDFFCGSGASEAPVLAQGQPVPTLTIAPHQCIIRTYLSLFSSCRLGSVPAQRYRFCLSLSTVGRPLPRGVWQGSVQSPPLELDLAEPQSEDKQYVEELLALSKAGKITIIPASLDLKTNPLTYYQLLNAYVPELTASHPRCIYTAWAMANWIEAVLPGYGGPFVRVTAGGLVGDALRLSYLRNTRDSYCAGKLSAPAEESSQLPRLIELCRELLKYHPELEPASSLTRLNLAGLLYVSGDTPAAKEQLEIVATAHPMWEEGRAAKRMLDVITSAPEGLPLQPPTGGGK